VAPHATARSVADMCCPCCNAHTYVHIAVLQLTRSGRKHRRHGKLAYRGR
jgi:hypothetical protein